MTCDNWLLARTNTKAMQRWVHRMRSDFKEAIGSNSGRVPKCSRSATLIVGYCCLVEQRKRFVVLSDNIQWQHQSSKYTRNLWCSIQALRCRNCDSEPAFALVAVEGPFFCLKANSYFARARILMRLWKIPNQSDFYFASKNCASTVLMPVLWHYLFAPLCSGKQQREAWANRNCLLLLYLL